MNCLYTDDSCNFIVHYLAGARPPPSKLNQWLAMFYRMMRIDQSFPSKTDRLRAKTICSLLDQNRGLDFSVQNGRGQGVLHFCSESNSVDCLRVILRNMVIGRLSPDRSPVLDLQDQDGFTPLTVALNRRHFQIVRLLMATGVLVHERRINQSPPVSPLAQPGPSIHSNLLYTVSSLTDMFHRKDQKLKELQKVLDHNRGVQQEMRVEARSFKDLQEVQTVFFGVLEVIRTQLKIDESTAQTLFVDSNFDLEHSLQSGAVFNHPSSAEELGTCMVCFEEFNAKNQCRIQLPCGHKTCDSCWTGYLLHVGF